MSIGRVPGATGIQPSIVTAKGDLIVATASGSVTNQAVGSNNQVLTADSAQADGVKWANGSAATLTTTGDILYASAANTPARLGIGSTNQVLTVSGGVPTWATPAASTSGLNLLTATTFSAVSSYSFPNSTFTSTYRNYRMLLEITSASANTDLRGRYRASGSDNTSNQYTHQTTTAATTSVTTQNATTTSTYLGELSTNTRYWLTIDFSDPNGTGQHLFMANIFDLNGSSTWQQIWVSGRFDGSNSFDSYSVFPSSGTITGAIAIYGYGK